MKKKKTSRSVGILLKTGEKIQLIICKFMEASCLILHMCHPSFFYFPLFRQVKSEPSLTQKVLFAFFRQNCLKIGSRAVAI